MNTDKEHQPIKEWQDKLELSQLLLRCGEDLTREGLEDTPRRVNEAWAEMLSGYSMEADTILQRTFEAEGTGLQVCRFIHFTSMCEHHLLPFAGYMHIGYQPDERVVGLSKLTRLVDCYAKRLQIQERLVQQIADALYEAIDPVCVFVIATAKHFCCQGRGVKRDRMDFVTSATRGHLEHKTELFSLMEILK